MEKSSFICLAIQICWILKQESQKISRNQYLSSHTDTQNEILCYPRYPYHISFPQTRMQIQGTLFHRYVFAPEFTKIKTNYQNQHKTSYTLLYQERLAFALQNFEFPFFVVYVTIIRN